jgi:hypothetical protein
MNKPDYANYTIEELLECKASIDSYKWPDRHNEILQELSNRSKTKAGKAEHDELVFMEYCEGLRSDLSLSIDAIFWPLVVVFSKSGKGSLPSVFRDENCPVCTKTLDAKNGWLGWRVICHHCKLDCIVRPKRSWY